MSGKIEVVLVVLGVAQRRGLRVDRVPFLADIGVPEDVHPLGIGRHDAVLDAVVHHLDEMAGAVWAAMQVALLGGAPPGSRAPACAGSRRARCQGGEDRVEMLHGSVSPPIIMQ